MGIKSLLFELEPAATLATGALAEIPAGLYGAAEAIRTGDPLMGAAAVQRVKDMYTYLPRTQPGMENLQSVGEGIQSLMDWPGLIPTISINDAIGMYQDRAGALGAAPAAALEGLFSLGMPAPARKADLAMDTASRMKRAAGQGFDTSRPLYRGTMDNEAGEVGQYWAYSPEYAAKYAYKDSGGIPYNPDLTPEIPARRNTMKAYAERPHSITETDGEVERFTKWIESERPELIPREGKALDAIVGPAGELNFQRTGEYLDYLDETGRNQPGLLLIDEMTENADTGVKVYDYDAIRSVNAAFDPKERYSGDFMAGIGGLSLLGLLAGGEEEEPEANIPYLYD